MQIVRSIAIVIVACATVMIALPGSISAQIPPATNEPPPAAVVVHREVKAILSALSQDGDFKKAKREIDALRDRVFLWAPLDKPDIFREVVRARRLIRGLDRAVKASRMELLGFLLKHENLASALVFALGPRDRTRDVCRVLKDLVDAFGDRVGRYAHLAAALCVVHDRPKRGKNRPGPVALFDYFTKKQSRMFFNVKTTPPELLKFIVDVDVSLKDLVWALERHAGDSNVGERYTDPPYDTLHFRQGKPKRISGKPYTLPNLRKYGGVCGDRGFFVTNIGSAIGVPTVAAVGNAGGVGHCWVGFLERRGRRVRWNFRHGRSYSFERVRGMVHDPQTRRSVADSDIMLTAELAGSDARGREQAVSLIDGAGRLRDLRRFRQRRGQPRPLVPDSKAGPRKYTTATELEFIEAALRKNRADRRGWSLVARLAKDGDLDYATIAKWAGFLERLCGKAYPDFSARLLADMIGAISDEAKQDGHWARAAKYFKWRKDLAAELRLRQGKMWEGAGKPDRAYLHYRAVAFDYVNDSPVVLTALKALDRLCKAQKREALIPKTYAAVWKKAHQPAKIAERKASNWYRIAAAYLRVLKRYKMTETEAKVRRKIASVIG